MHRITLWAAGSVFVICAGFVARADEQRINMGGFPVCEASAALLVDCPESGRKCLLVGDNEMRTKLFLYQLQDSAPVLHNRREISLEPLFSSVPIDKRELSDIEALVGMPTDEIIAYGSHSRNKKCKNRKNRRRHVRGSLDNDSLKVTSTPFVQSKKHKCNRLFGDEPDAIEQTVCAVLERTEDRADDVKDGNSIASCNADPAFNLEGAVAVPESNGAPASVWVGLRAPLVNGNAVLLRHADPSNKLRFDKVAFVDLGGYGIRELTIAGDKIWGIAGSTADSDEKHTLWHFSASDLEHGVVISPSIAGSLPNSSEGMAIWNQKMFVLIDGDKPKNDGEVTCLIDSEYVIRDVSTP